MPDNLRLLVGGARVGLCFTARKKFRQEALWIAESVAIVAARSGSESRGAGASAGAVGALEGPR